MYIEPNSNITIYHNVPLDNTYNHTLYFSNLAEQNTYFHANQNIIKYNLTAQSYQRVVKGSMRVAVKADNLYDCNYLAFQNSSFGSKWFYAFITSVEYINNETSEIKFEIDVMQTYIFDVELRQCYVEREHSVTDVAGDNIVAEPIDIGDITCNNVVGTGKFSSYVAVIATAYDSDGQAGGYQGGLFSGVKYIPALLNTHKQIQSALDFLDAIVEANKQDSVVAIFIMPTAFFTTGEAPSVEVSRVAKNTKIHGYEPKNKKLLTYPYNYLSVDCGNNDAIYRYEWFNDEYCDFEIVGTVSCNPQIMLVPQNYNGVSDDGFNYVEKLVMSDFPQVAWGIDSFKAWLAQEASSTAIQGIASAGAIAAGAISGNPLAMAGGIVGLTNNANNVVLATNRPPQAKGTNSGTIDVASRTKDFYFRQMQVSKQYAKIIDDFFDMYGYATNRVKVPNISSRPHWNYVKTKGCVLKGNAPADDVRKICSIYDNGITFWKKASEVGNYNFNNKPT